MTTISRHAIIVLKERLRARLAGNPPQELIEVLMSDRIVEEGVERVTFELCCREGHNS